jgi:predicted RNA-binding Zn ribbon-like protein
MFKWTSHRFSGGVLALDLVNTVVWKDLPEKREDRFADKANIASFAEAASVFRSAEVSGKRILPPDSPDHIKHLLHLRDTLDKWLRPPALQNDGTALNTAALFDACAKASLGKVDDPMGIVLGEACALSAIRFFEPKLQHRVKRCPACRWLFLDKSKNQSRQWCDMKICGNRAKAQAHYARMKITRVEFVA